MSAVGAVGGGAPSMPPPSQGAGGDDPFEGEEMEGAGGSEFGGEAAGGSETVDISSIAGGEDVGTSTESFEDDGGAASYDASGGVDDLDAGGEIDAMV
ncbi:hypothetical protein LRF89_12160 [Halorhodospira sp. 9621]|uniref:hypothetical protein n=1 Tax=Halorhodospira sp. 9621 TaxID=2899135 RepID=UPI001EE8258B|nr:hypothetical protein [Halorhodospira sp. 9621]MCG5534188.1 hypothetical protein [Halorhodospira sp. 9621]